MFRGRVMVQFAPAVFHLMKEEAARFHPCEAGGILMGWWLRPDAEVFIANAIGGGPAAKHERFSFEPDTGWQRRQVAAIYAASDRTCTYLGDWHSHPDGSPRPSRLDVLAAASIAQSPEARAPNPVMAILGGSIRRGFNVEVYCYRRRSLDRCRVVADEG